MNNMKNIQDETITNTKQHEHDNEHENIDIKNKKNHKDKKKNVLQNNEIQVLKSENDQLQSENLLLKDNIQKYEKTIWNIKLSNQAEIENIRKRSALDIENTYKFSLEKIITELLPVIDNLERAIILEKNNDNFNSIVEGINLTLKSFINTIKKFGVEIIDKINIPFNPLQHQAMSVVKSDTIQDNYIIEVLQKGYMLNGRLLRPAMVIISQN
ncbi:nucleotide exchange factor GrpE [Enterobacteriaceae endosymbiont of Neohaemonia nigricornis]|uniref:nucleotide exchange factor GrpE n=1 Tax=Enterobacteriaceae endosymbiont of Neohaemonia nigricornis TaxID=2675792 RepID=UPI001449033B|nr:nucleotide exchange factor GrpE [Enterobacteriaceae endosymbiont of Neohaemonia nigricornis]QJC30567.1 nucleotide exchange factor GrpE [Enterobacteriaceae endosymbiont of Neohaemonia nigricornis]